MKLNEITTVKAYIGTTGQSRERVIVVVHNDDLCVKTEFACTSMIVINSKWIKDI